MSMLLSPFKLRDVVFRNRIFVSPMCQYSSRDGFPTDWHLVHLGSRAVGGAGLVMVEATAVAPWGRISPSDSGLWSEAHGEAFGSIASFLKSQGAVPGIQLAHAGRKASTRAPWRGTGQIPESEGGWRPVAPSPIPFDGADAVPKELTVEDIRSLVERFSDATRFARMGGFEVVEIHMAHGYLAHQFLSPLSNHRKDDYGGSLENRMRFPLEVTSAVRGAWPSHLPVFARISATDWVEEGWDLTQAVEFARRLRAAGVDLVDCSSGGTSPHAKIPAAPGFQVPFAEAVKKGAGIATGAVGLITVPAHADEIVSTGKADVVFLARQLLRDPYWPLHAAQALGDKVDYWPAQYGRAKPS
ncbi:MAG: NADH:flavin oxidoreductase/NADH oxidase [Acidobacteriia bacterium]|nr:NADH:flavin oxidoreductase/NADH oxidase [Terriglobia bacterium]